MKDGVGRPKKANPVHKWRYSKKQKQDEEMAVLQRATLQSYRRLKFDPLTEKNALKYLDLRTLEYIQRLELIADEARANQEPELELKTVAFLSRLTPAYRTKVDIGGAQLGLMKAPSLEQLSPAELTRIAESDDGTDLSAIESKLIKEDA